MGSYFKCKDLHFIEVMCLNIRTKLRNEGLHSMKKIIMFVLAISLATILAACSSDSDSASDDKNKEKKSEKTAQQEKPASKDIKIADKEKVDNDKVVSKVNGETIKGKEYNSLYAQIKMSMNENGQDVSDVKKVKEEALAYIVEQEVLKQDAQKQGIKVSDKEIQKQLDTIKSQNGEKFDSVLKQYHTTEASFKDQLEFKLIMQKYVKQEVKADKVTDKEVKSYYDKLKEQSKGSKDSQKVPELDKIKDQIKGQLKQQKQQMKLQAKMEKLKKDAKVNHMI